MKRFNIKEREYMYLIILIIGLTAIDQLSKLYMYNISNGEVGYSIPIINNFFHFSRFSL